MPSYTSSSDRNVLPGIVVPQHGWARIGLITLAITLLAVGAWELRVRSLGYRPSFDDTPGLWSMSRDRLASLDNPIVVVGDSRIRFNLDHDITRRTFDDRPLVSLAMNGSVARPVLSLLAKDESFKGTVLLSYNPLLFWVPGGPPLANTMEWIDKHDNRTVAARWGQYIKLAPDAAFAFVEKDDLALMKMLRGGLPLPNREGVMTGPRMPPYFCAVHLDRREVMWERVTQDPAFAAEIQGIWKGLLGVAKPLPPDLLAKLRGDVVADIRTIQARGGEVIIITYPSTGWLREWEEQNAPRTDYYEPLVAESGCLAVHFQDHAELRDFDCPEWSHLSGPDAILYTEHLMRIIAEKRAAR